MLALLSQGLSNKDIAARLVISLNTVKRHVKAITASWKFIARPVRPRRYAAQKSTSQMENNRLAFDRCGDMGA